MCESSAVRIGVKRERVVLFCWGKGVDCVAEGEGLKAKEQGEARDECG